MRTRDGLLTAARDAYARRDWRESYDAFTQAQSSEPLGIGDLDALGVAAYRIGHGKESICISEEVFERLLAGHSPSVAAMKALDLALMWLDCGDLAVTQGWMNRARRLLDGLPEDAAHGYLLFMEASVTIVDGTFHGVAERAQRLRDMGRRLESPAISTLALVVGGLAAIGESRTADGFAMLDEAMLPILADQLPLEWAGGIYCTVLHHCHQLADFARMRAWSHSMERWCQSLAMSAPQRGVCDVHRAQLEVATSGYGILEDRLTKVTTALEELHIWGAAQGHYELGEIRRLRGDVDGALAAFAKVREFGIDPQPGEALLRCQQGDHQGARDAVRAALGSADPLHTVRLLRGAVDIALAADDIDEAERHCRRLEREAERFDTAGFRAWAAHARGALLVKQDRPAEALTALQSALALYRSLRCRYDTAQIYEWMSLAHKAAGDVEMAEADVATAESIYKQLGVVPGTMCGSQACPGGLTKRELEILACIAGGATNRQVAEKTFISEKTVGRHLANIYAKLGVSSRTAATAWAHEHNALSGR